MEHDENIDNGEQSDDESGVYGGALDNSETDDERHHDADAPASGSCSASAGEYEGSTTQHERTECEVAVTFSLSLNAESTVYNGYDRHRCRFSGAASA